MQHRDGGNQCLPSECKIEDSKWVHPVTLGGNEENMSFINKTGRVCVLPSVCVCEGYACMFECNKESRGAKGKICNNGVKSQ